MLHIVIMDSGEVNIVHPRFRDELTRLRSFPSWLNFITRLLYAFSGFFCTGESKVCCFSCGITFFQREAVGNPDEMHARLKPSCPHFMHVQSKGFPLRIRKAYSETVKMRLYDSKYKDFRSRMSTFTEGSPEIDNKQELSSNGFYSKGPDQGIWCYSCGYKPLDNVEPISGHLKYSPFCRHLENCVNPEVLMSCKVDLKNRSLSMNRNIHTEDNMQSRHPKYRNMIDRTITFRNWKRASSPLKFAKAGFFNTDFDDTVKCFCCNYGFTHRRENRDDIPVDPAWIHAYCSPDCQFVQKTTPEYFVTGVQMMHRGDNQINEDLDHLNVNSRLKFQYFRGKRHVGKPSDHHVYSAAAQYAVHQLGFYEDHVKEVIDDLMKKEYSGGWNVDLLANIILDKQEKGELQSRPINVHQRQECQLESYRCRECHRSVVDALFLPCKHLVLCLNCASSVTQCPICQHDVAEKVRTYLS